MKHGVLGGTRSSQIVFFLSIYWKAYFEERVICCGVHEREREKINFAGLRLQRRTKEEDDERERERGGVMYVCMCEREKSLKLG